MELIESPIVSPEAGGRRELRRPRRLRLLRRSLLFLVAFELAYVLAFEWAARTGRLERWANRHPHRWSVSFSEAHSWFPFYGTAEGVELRARTPAMLVGCRVDRASGWLSPLPLLQRRMRLLRARVDGVELRLLHFEAERALAGSDRAADLPEIEPLPPEPPGAPPPRRRWTLDLPAVAASGVREAWINRFHFEGDAKGSGALEVEPGREITIFGLDVALASGRLLVGPEKLAESLRGAIDLALAPYDLTERDPGAMLDRVTATGKVEAAITTDAARRALLANGDWLELDPEPAQLTAELAVASGRLLPGTRVLFSQPGFDARMFTLGCRGDLEGTFEVADTAAGPRGLANARFASFEIRRGEAAEPEIIGTGLSIRSEVQELRIAALPGEGVARIDLGEARLPNLATFADTFPPSLALQLEGGSGRVSGQFEVAVPALQTRGAMESTLEGVKVRYGDLDLAGRTRLALVIASDNLASGRFDLSGTKVELSEFESARLARETPEAESGWWATIDLHEGTAVLMQPVTAQGRLAVRLRDSVPMVGLFETRKNLPRWVERLLTVQDLSATAGFAYDDRDFQLLDFETVFRKAKIRAKARFGKEHRAGAMMVEWHKVALGLRFDDQKKRFKFVGVRPWYAKQQLDRPETAGAEDPLEVYSPEALRGVAFEGTTVQSVELEESEPGSNVAGAEAPEREIVPDRIVVGDLDGEPPAEAALLLRETDGGALHLAVAAEVTGQPVSRALLALRESESPARMEIAERMIVLAWAQSPPATAAPSGIAESATPSPPPVVASPGGFVPPSERRRRFRLAGTDLAELPEPESVAPPAP